MFLFSTILYIHLVVGGFAVPFHPSPRDAIPTKPALNTTILDQNGVDVTSNFTIMLYKEEPKMANTSSLNDRGITARPINDCRNLKFVESHCTPHDGKLHGMQSWQITCATRAEVSLPPSNGYCNADEVCINGWTASSPRSIGTTRLMANCVSRHSFLEIAAGQDIPGNLDVEGILEAWDNMVLTMAVSKPDGITPVVVDMFDVEAKVNSDGTARQRKTCNDCLDLETDPFAPGTDLLKTQTKLMSTGLAAGMLWLAFTSG